jgi:ribonuclease HII
LPDRHTLPGLDLEQRLWAQGFSSVAGLDEVGRGTWAGPVVAAAVVFPCDDPHLGVHLAGVRDSKLLSPARRVQWLARIYDHAVSWGVGSAPACTIDRVGIVPATRQAMERALSRLLPPPDSLLIDHLHLPGVALPQHSLPHGDALVLSIAAASIVAKVFRDWLMRDCDLCFPGYGFAQHKGYGTPQHRAALRDLGPSAIHRLTFSPLRSLHGFAIPSALRQPGNVAGCAHSCCCLLSD